MKRTSFGATAYGVAAFTLVLFGPAVHGFGQAPKVTRTAPAFEVVSLKRTGNMADHRITQNGRARITGRRVQYQGLRLSGDALLSDIIEFACSPLLLPYRQEASPWIRDEFYQIEAVAPAGTTLDEARVMLRRALAERLGLQYHLGDRETPVYNLVQGDGKVKLVPATEVDADPGARQAGVFKMKSASLADFAEFVSMFARQRVVDRTGIQGRYRFNVDWSDELRQDPGNTVAVALTSVKSLGLKLEAGKTMVKVLVVDHANKEPTAN